MKNKKIFLVIIAIFVIAIIVIFLILHYKKQKSGNNNINKSEEDIINNILNMKSYNAKLDIKIETNKNKTKYIVEQKLEEGKAYQEIKEPQNIAGVVTEYDGTNLKITNNKLNLESTFENYQYIVENRLWLDSFIEEYKSFENIKKQTSGENIILEIRRKDNPYNVIKKLYIDIKTGKPSKMIVQDINKKTLVHILYTEIDIS